MGLLDALFAENQGGGGLLSYLQSQPYPSPLNQPQEAPPQPQYDAMGNYTGITPQTAASPFPQPDLTQWAQQFAPKSAFNGTAPQAPVQFSGGPSTQPQAPAAPQPTPMQPQQPTNQVNDINVGGYQMPRLGSVADYTPQARPTDVSSQSRQPQAPEQPQSLPPAFGGLGSSLGRAFNPDGLIARLTGNDSRSQAQQNLKAQYEALVPLVGQQKAMLAVLNPEAGKTILAQALEKKQYGFQKLDGDTVLRTDPLTGKAEVAYGGGDENKNGIAGPDGKIIKYPEGLDSAGRKVFANEIARINADAAVGKKTGEQATAEIYANKMELSNKTLDTLASQGTSLTGKLTSGLPMGNYLQSPEYQKYKQAASNFITALLRKESGAAIGKEEFDRYDKEYMPQPGDGPEVLAQKTEARRVAIESMKKGAGAGYKSPTASPLPSGWSVSVR